MTHEFKPPVYSTSERFFTFPGIAAVLVLFFTIAAIANNFLLISGFLLCIPLFIWIKSVYLFDIEKSSFRNALQIFGFRTGKWIPTGRMQAVLISNPTYEKKMGPVGTASLPFSGADTFKGSNWKLELLSQNGKKYYVAEFDDKEDCLELAVQISQDMKVEVYSVIKRPDRRLSLSALKKGKVHFPDKHLKPQRRK